MPDAHAPHNPFEGVTDYFSELNRLRQRGVYGQEPGQEVSQRTHASAWVPATDIYLRGEDLVIKVELAGVRPEEVHLGLSHGVLTVSGSRRSDVVEDDRFYVRERFYGEFRRSFTLPEGTEAGRISAEFADGLVEVRVAGAATDSGTRIEVKNRSDGPTRRTLA